MTTPPAQPEQDPNTTAYRAWMRHAGFNDVGKRCEECAAAPAPTMGCEEGKRLWGNYRLARIAKAVPVSDGS